MKTERSIPVARNFCMPNYFNVLTGTTAHHLIDGIDELTSGDIYGRFFHFWPPREIELKKWLAVWMKKGWQIYTEERYKGKKGC